MTIWITMAAVWVLGLAFTASALCAMGSRRDDTYGDSYSGDDGLDTLLAVLWPIWWPCWMAWHTAQFAVRKIADG